MNGFNMPIRINNNAHCDVSECSVDLGANCELSDQMFHDLALNLTADSFKVLHESKNLTSKLASRLDSLAGAIVHALQASRPTQPTTQIAVQEDMTTSQPACHRAFSIMIISVSFF